MEQLYGKSSEQIIQELGELLYRTPDGTTRRRTPIFGQCKRRKLAEAEEAAKNDPDMRRNVAALRDVIPADIEAVDIDVKPGAPWMPKKHVENFVNRIISATTRTRPIRR